MESAPVWLPEIVEEGEGKSLRYRLRDPNIGYDSNIPSQFHNYLNRNDYYVKLSKANCNMLSLGYNDVCLSMTFINDVMKEDGSYPWQISRIDASETEQLNWSQFTARLHNGAFPEVRGGYVIPARYSNGSMEVFKLPDRWLSFPLRTVWMKILKTSSSIYSGNFDISAMRALDPKPEDMVLIIQPPGDGVTYHHGVAWDQVVEAFNQVMADPKVKARYVFEFPTKNPKDYILLWHSPFDHFRTYISDKHMQRYLATYKDRPFPEDSDEMLKWLRQLGSDMQPEGPAEERTDRLVKTGSMYTFSPAKPKLKSKLKNEKAKKAGMKSHEPNESQERPHLAYDQITCSIPLSAEKIFAASGKRGETINQNQVMNYHAASDIAQKYFGWKSNPADFRGVKHVAEWLHISAFAYGGLASGSKAWESSQVALNMVLGSSETNSMMIRYEKAWQEFFKLEHDLRKYYRDAGRQSGKNTAPVIGELVAQVNQNLQVHRFVDNNNGSFSYHQEDFDSHPWWPRYFEECPWLCLAMEYNVSMKGKSELFDWLEPNFVIDFYPFSRLFFTKGETMVDIKLLKGAFEQKKAEFDLETLQHGAEKQVSGQNNSGSMQEEVIFQETFSMNSAPFSNVVFEERVLSSRKKAPKNVLSDLVEKRTEELDGTNEVDNKSEEDDESAQITAFEEEYRAQLLQNRAAAPVLPGIDSEESESMAALEHERMAQIPESHPPAQLAASEQELHTEAVAAPVQSEPNPMQSLESQLIVADEFNRLESLEALLDITTVEFRDTLEASPSIILFEGTAAITEGSEAILESTPELNYLVEVPDVNSSAWNAQSNLDVSVPNDIPITEPVNTILIGGIPLNNIRLVVSTGEDAYADLPVTVRALDIAATQEGLLLAPIAGTNNSAPTEAPILVLATGQRSDMQVVGPALVDGDALMKDTTQSFQNVGTAAMPAFMISGDVSDLFGIPYLSATLYTVQNKDPNVPVYETVKPNMLALTESPIKTLFPFIENDIMKYLPIENFQFVYSEDDRSILHPAGLRVEADLQFKDGLQDIGDALKDLFGPDNIAPTGLHVAAHLSHERDWNRMPYMSRLCLQGSFQNMSIGLGKHVKITRMGVEVSASRVSDFGKENKWMFGYGFFGTLEIHNFPGTVLMEANYRLRKIGDTYHMAMDLASDEWQDVFGVENFTVRGVQFETSFSTESIKESFRLRISAFMLLRNANIYLSGQYTKEESFLEAEIGNLTFAEISQVYAELIGESVSEDTNGNDLKFESLYLKISTNGIVLSGKVAFNGTASAQAMISITRDGLGISGGIGNYKIPDTDITIQEAALDVFIGASTKSATDKVPKRASRFGIRGIVDFEGNRVSAGFSISTSTSGERQWMLYGAFDGDLRLSKINSELRGTDMDISLRKAAIIASNFTQDASNVSGLDGMLNVMNYPTSKGIQLCALIDPLPTLNELAKGEIIEGLMLVASFGFNGKLGLAVRMPKSFTIELSETTSMSNFGVAIEISKLSRIILDGDLKIKMKKQDPLIFKLALFAGMLEAGGFVRSLTVWKNPFDISEQVEIRSLALEIAFSYLTMTPSKLALEGTVAVGDIIGSAAMSVSQMPDQQLLSVDISRINVAEMIRFAGKIAESQSLQNLEGGDFLVFTEAKMYFSTGASIAGVVYPAGITASGAMTLFGKTAKFSATVGTSGICFFGSVNAFKIGPLEIKSASGAPDASLDIAMTTSEQRFLINGQIKLWELSLKMYINIAISPAVVFKVDVFIGFADTFGFTLKAEAKNVTDFKDLSKASFTLEASLSGDIFGLICDCVIGVLNTIEELGDAGFAAMDKVLQEGVAETNRRLDGTKEEVAEANRQVQQERQRRQKIIDFETERNRAADDELVDLEAKLASAQNMQQEEIARAKERYDQIYRERARLIQQKTGEYDEALKKAKQEHDMYENLQGYLEKQMREKYGPIRVKARDSDQRYTVQQAVVREMDEKIASAQRSYDNAFFLLKPPAFVFLTKLRAEREIGNFLLDQLGDGWNFLNSQLESAGYKTLDESIQRGTNDIVKTVGALGKLQSEGPSGFIRAMQEDEDQKVRNAYLELETAKQGSKWVIKAIQDAQRELDIKAPRLRSIIAAADENIARVSEDATLAVLNTRYENTVAQELRIAQELQQLRANLDLLHKDFKEGVKDLKDVVEKIKNRMFRITKIGVKIAVGDAKEGKPLTFVVEGKTGEKVYNFNVEWDPRQSAAELYRGIAKKAIAL